jgi:hypothetical protein
MRSKGTRQEDCAQMPRKIKWFGTKYRSGTGWNGTGRQPTRNFPIAPENRYHPPQVRGSSGESRLISIGVMIAVNNEFMYARIEFP